MKTFKNTQYKNINTELSNIVFCQSETAPNENWTEVDETENNLNQLYMQNGVRYFGYL